MNKCKTCRFWKNFDNPSLTPPDPPLRMCQHPKLFESGMGDVADDVLQYSYQEGGGFEVGPEFGCVHWTSE